MIDLEKLKIQLAKLMGNIYDELQRVPSNIIVYYYTDKPQDDVVSFLKKSTDDYGGLVQHFLALEGAMDSVYIVAWDVHIKMVMTKGIDAATESPTVELVADPDYMQSYIYRVI